MSTSHLDIYAQVILLRFSIYQSAVKPARQSRETDLVLPCREGRCIVRAGIYWQSYRIQEALLHKYLILSCCSCISLCGD